MESRMKIVSLEKALPKVRKRLGEILVEAGLIDQKTLESALAAQKVQNKKLGQILVDMGGVTETHIADVLSKQLGIRCIRLNKVMIQPRAISLINQAMAEKYDIVPLQIIDKKLVIAMSNPLDYNALEDIQFAVSRPVYVAVTTPSDIAEAIERYYPKKDLREEIISPAEMDASMEVIQRAKVEDKSDQELASMADLPPVVRFTNAIFADSMKRRASDIHIEPQIDDQGQPNLIVRCRIDGIMYETLRTDRHVHPSLVSRIKIISGLDISEKRKPQDGKAQIKYENDMYDLRVSTIPTTYGEKITIRILNPASAKMGPEDLGFTERDLTTLTEAISRPQGIILVTGPTGSGKSSTLYACLNRLNKPSVNIITVEDPVEFDVAGINQVQINAKAGISFAAGLRSILRQDPDIVMVGEIRDAETAEVAFEAAQTGHLVLSTLHTNDAPAAITRLLDLGVDDFQISDALVAVVGQRLVRRIHPACKVEAYVSERVLERMRPYLKGRERPLLWEGTGCEKCQGSGLSGRMGIYEILAITPALRDLIKPEMALTSFKRAAAKSGYRTLAEDGIVKALQGLTTIDEVFRVAPPEMDAEPAPEPEVSRPARSPLADQQAPPVTDGERAPAAKPVPKPGVSAFAEERVPQKSDQPRTVLVVDDVEIDRMIICDALEDEGYETTEAEDGLLALEALKKDSFDLIVADYLMPRMDGETLVKELKAHPVHKRIPILMLTSVDAVQSEITLLKAGADEYVTKPVNREKFLIRVANLLRRSS